MKGRVREEEQQRIRGGSGKRWQETNSHEQRWVKSSSEYFSYTTTKHYKNSTESVYSVGFSTPEAPCDFGRQEAAGVLVLIHSSKNMGQESPPPSIPPAIHLHYVGMCANSPQSAA